MSPFEGSPSAARSHISGLEEAARWDASSCRAAKNAKVPAAKSTPANISHRDSGFVVELDISLRSRDGMYHRCKRCAKTITGRRGHPISGKLTLTALRSNLLPKALPAGPEGHVGNARVRHHIPAVGPLGYRQSYAAFAIISKPL